MMQKMGVTLLLVGLATLGYNISDALNDLSNWHSATTPQFVAAVVKQVSAVLLAAIGGTLMPQPRRSPREKESDS